MLLAFFHSFKINHSLNLPNSFTYDSYKERKSLVKGYCRLLPKARDCLDSVFKYSSIIQIKNIWYRRKTYWTTCIKAIFSLVRAMFRQKSTHLTHTIKHTTFQPSLKTVPLNLFWIFKAIAKALPIELMAYCRSTFLMISEVLETKVARLRTSGPKKMKQKQSRLSEESELPSTSIRLKGHYARPWWPAACNQSHSQPASFAQPSDVKAQRVPQQCRGGRSTESSWKLYPQPLLSLDQRLSYSNGLPMISLSLDTAQNAMPGGSTLHRYKRRANSLQNHFPHQYLENTSQV